MERACRRCKGERGRYVNRRSSGFFGVGRSSRDWVRCDACGGSGVNPKYRETRCERCYRTIGYSVDSKFPPKYCENCKPIVAAEKQRERESRKHSQQHSQQSSSYQPQRQSQSDMWREKSCPGLKGENGCATRSTIRYRTDWAKQPDLCPNCIQRIKTLKAEREAKTREKPCARPGCPNKVRYNVDWDHPPEYCKSCSEMRLKVDNQNGTLQAHTKDGTLVFTFGRCRPPRADRTGDDANRRREWANRGYYWVSLPGNPHETYIVDKNPVEKGFISIGNTRDVSYSTAALRSLWAMLAITIANGVE